MAATDQLSGITVVYLIAIGFQIFVLLFLFGKRQVMRFAWGSRKESHISVASSCPKALKAELIAAIDRIEHVDIQPPLARYVATDGSTAPYRYRMKALDDLKILDSELTHANYDVRRKTSESVYKFLSPIKLFNQEHLRRFCYLAEQAQYARQEFKEQQYKEFSHLLAEVTTCIRRNRQALENLNAAQKLRTKDSEGCIALDTLHSQEPLLQVRTSEPRSPLQRLFRNISLNKTKEAAV